MPETAPTDDSIDSFASRVSTTTASSCRPSTRTACRIRGSSWRLARRADEPDNAGSRRAPIERRWRQMQRVGSRAPFMIMWLRVRVGRVRPLNERELICRGMMDMGTPVEQRVGCRGC